MPAHELADPGSRPQSREGGGVLWQDRDVFAQGCMQNGPWLLSVLVWLARRIEFAQPSALGPCANQSRTS